MRAALLLCIPMAGILPASPAVAGECPAAPDTTEARAALLSDLAAAPDEAAGRALQDRLWRLYVRAPDAAAQALLDEGMRRRDAWDWAGAEALFSQLAARCPDYAEGWNQRAFVRFLRGNHAGALADLEVALRLAPDHVPARAGLAVTLLAMGEAEAGRQALLEALALNPWLPERGLLAPAPPAR